jgi:hypothetical protein
MISVVTDWSSLAAVFGEDAGKVCFLLVGTEVEWLEKSIKFRLLMITRFKYENKSHLVLICSVPKKLKLLKATDVKWHQLGPVAVSTNRFNYSWDDGILAKAITTRALTTVVARPLPLPLRPLATEQNVATGPIDPMAAVPTFLLEHPLGEQYTLLKTSISALGEYPPAAVPMLMNQHFQYFELALKSDLFARKKEEAHRRELNAEVHKRMKLEANLEKATSIDLLGEDTPLKRKAVKSPDDPLKVEGAGNFWLCLYCEEKIRGKAVCQSHMNDTCPDRPGAAK